MEREGCAERVKFADKSGWMYFSRRKAVRSDIWGWRILKEMRLDIIPSSARN